MQAFNDYVLLARDISVDSRDQMLSIFKVVDGFTFSFEEDVYAKFQEDIKKGAVGLPATYVMSSCWSLDKPVKKNMPALLRSRIIDPEGKELASSTNEVMFIAGQDKLRINGATEGIPVTTNGRYKVEVTLIDPVKDEELATNTTTYQVTVDRSQIEPQIS